MKLIIDIPYEAYYTFKCDLGKGNLNALAEIIANGKPYEETPQGEWEDYSADFYKCPECGYLLNKLCPNCQNKVILPISDRYNEGFRDGYAQCINDREERKENNRLFQKGGAE